MAEACSVASYRQLAWTAAWHLREETYRQRARDPGKRPAAPAARRLVRGRRCVQLGRTALPDRRPGRSRRSGQRPLRAHRFRAFLHAPFGSPGAVPHGRDPALRRGRLCHRRPALPRGRPEHRDPSHRWRRRQRSRLRLGISARLLFRPAHPQPGRAAPLHLRTGERLAGARAVHRRAHRRKADHGALG